MRMSSVRTGSVTTCTMPGSARRGSELRWWIERGEEGKEMKLERVTRVTHDPPHLAVLYNIIRTD